MVFGRIISAPMILYKFLVKNFSPFYKYEWRPLILACAIIIRCPFVHCPSLGIVNSVDIENIMVQSSRTSLIAPSRPSTHALLLPISRYDGGAATLKTGFEIKGRKRWSMSNCQACRCSKGCDPVEVISREINHDPVASPTITPEDARSTSPYCFFFFSRFLLMSHQSIFVHSQVGGSH
jgi:hypothetical protein